MVGKLELHGFSFLTKMIISPTIEKMNLIAKNRIRPSETDARRSSGNLRFDLRSPLDSDYGRLVFSSAFRRLHDKTQVFPVSVRTLDLA